MKIFYTILFAFSLLFFTSPEFACKKNNHSPSVSQSITVNAGADRGIVLPRDTVTLHGIAISYGGLIVSTHWVEISGPNQANIVSATAASTLISGLTAGVYDFEFSAVDSNGKTASDRILVTVYSTDPCNGCWDY